MFRVSPKTKNVLWKIVIDSLLLLLIWLTDFRNVLLNTIFQRERILRIDRYPQNQFRYTVPG